jgi:uncharacterized protein YPO0396
LAIARGNSRLAADLQKQINADTEKRNNLSRALLLSVASGIVGEMQSWVTKWSSDDNAIQSQLGPHVRSQLPPQQLARLNQLVSDMAKDYTNKVLPLLNSANSVRDELLRSFPQTEEDQRDTAIFAKVLAGEPIYFGEMRNITYHMENLVKRFASPASSNSPVQSQ